MKVATKKEGQIPMTFVQIIEYETTHEDEMQRLFEEWVRSTEGKRTTTRELHSKDHDNPTHFVEIVEFPSYERAMANNDLPETQRMAEKFRSLCTGEPRFVNLDVVSEQV